MSLAQRLPEHPAYALKRHDKVEDAATAATLRAELYGDEYVIVDTGLGFAAVRLADLPQYDIAHWRLLGSRGSEERRQRANAVLLRVTNGQEQATP